MFTKIEEGVREHRQDMYILDNCKCMPYNGLSSGMRLIGFVWATYKDGEVGVRRDMYEEPLKVVKNYQGQVIVHDGNCYRLLKCLKKASFKDIDSIERDIRYNKRKVS